MSENSPTIPRPELILPEQETALLRAAYEEARVILEYGVGGSTILAAEMAGKVITSVETDRHWVKTLQDWFVQNPCKSKPDIIWANIGPTKAWGRPANEEHWKDYAKYPLEIWSLEDAPLPDVVLVDGRFRAGCVLATAFRCNKDTRVLVDDYKRRESYHAIEKFVGAPRMTGRMAEFEITPTPIPAKHLLEIITLMQDPY
ncbi:MAG: hypothetical protein WBC85_02200 [Planktotalea sp.]|uniref:hypothetical protein n=1 Tax=Planktotalea sp. TaxID=2029877 RepID=UPI003C78B5A4